MAPKKKGPRQKKRGILHSKINNLRGAEQPQSNSTAGIRKCFPLPPVSVAIICGRGFREIGFYADSKQIHSRRGGAEGNMTVATFAKKTGSLAGGSANFVHTALCESQPTDQKARSAQNEIRLFGTRRFWFGVIG